MNNYISYLVWWFHMWFVFQADLTSHTPCCSNSPTRIQTEWHTVAFWSLWQMKASVISLTGYNIYSRSTHTGSYKHFCDTLLVLIMFHFVLRWCRTCCWRRVVWFRWRAWISWWPHTPNSSRRVQTSWISQILKLCKYRNNLHILHKTLLTI